MGGRGGTTAVRHGGWRAASAAGAPSIHDLIAELGVRVEYSLDLPPGRLGAYLDDERRIVIRAGLSAPLERETLHHEYIHARYRDRASTPAAERRAERESAVMLIDEASYAEAERCGLSALDIARHLDVPLAVIEVYQREILAGRIADPRLRARGAAS
ncbi:hypothetical protein ELQ92_00790 [Labedella populi]|uniref:ImmA/IrrE family metallo-endopeptidase n=1 Tax=Labedella populi TaxID=2498850 RepID=A0A444QE33_9MICO|nr:hypothetical protein [Labedella populi]RWZ67842.1 hypothetical protein ELQ92_00790 [Labedella populi]